ncbi:MAG: class I SAM-dependent methyltransferase [Acetobacteraceae bacterium]
MQRANARYYASRDPFHEFATGPEISQVFGEIVGLWAATVWEAFGRPDPILLVELGPGRGTLMQDALRAVAEVAAPFRRALHVHLVETSPRLRALQEKALPDATWHADWAELPDGPMLLLANEFLDALPIRQFVHRSSGWTERFVQGGQFIERPAAPPPPREAPLDAVVEISEPALALAAALGARFAPGHRNPAPGAALFFDYGPAASAPGDSLQALCNGRPADPLAEPGMADLSAHVDFQSFAATARAQGASVSGPLAQGLFLTRLGLFQRLDRLARGRSPAQAALLLAGGRRLVEPDGMGQLFKVLALSSTRTAALPGFAP